MLERVRASNAARAACPESRVAELEQSVQAGDAENLAYRALGADDHKSMAAAFAEALERFHEDSESRGVDEADITQIERDLIWTSVSTTASSDRRIGEVATSISPCATMIGCVGVPLRSRQAA
jgi:hypothetical protein